MYIAAGAVKGAHKVGKGRSARQEQHTVVLDHLEREWLQAISCGEEPLITLCGQMHEAGVCRRVNSSLPGALEDDQATLQEKK